MHDVLAVWKVLPCLTTGGGNTHRRARAIIHETRGGLVKACGKNQNTMLPEYVPVLSVTTPTSGKACGGVKSIVDLCTFCFPFAW